MNLLITNTEEEQPYLILRALRQFDDQGVTRDGAFATLRRWKNEYR